MPNRELLRAAQRALQEQGHNRREARRAVWGNTRRDAESHPTRGAMLNESSARHRERVQIRDDRLNLLMALRKEGLWLDTDASADYV